MKAVGYLFAKFLKLTVAQFNNFRSLEGRNIV